MWALIFCLIGQFDQDLELARARVRVAAVSVDSGVEKAVEKSTEKHPHILFLTQKNCLPCAAAEIELQKIKARGFIVGKLGVRSNVSIVDIKEFPDVAQKYSVEATPTFVLVSGDKELARFEGFMSSVDILDFYYQKTKRKQTSKPVVRSNYNPRWTWPGNLKQHLESVHGINTAGMSQDQLESTHDRLHEGR